MRKQGLIAVAVLLWGGLVWLWLYQWPRMQNAYTQFKGDQFQKKIKQMHKRLPHVALRASSHPSRWQGKSNQSPFVCQGVTPVQGRPALRLQRLAKGFKALTDVVFAPGDMRRLFVLEQNTGRVRIIRDGKVLRQPFLNIRSRLSVGGERGLLGMAFHPKYPTNRKFYLYYTDRRGDVVVAEFQATQDPDKANPGSFRQVIKAKQPEGNHNGGSLRFGPDGYLYIGLGDGGSGGDPHGPIGNGQASDTWLGKILRIDINRREGQKPYAIPPDNPFRKDPKFLPEIAYWGLRNPWRFSFDRLTGSLWLGDVGQNLAEEINFAPKGVFGLNFGWRCKEGLLPFGNDKHCATKTLVDPVVHLKQHVRKARFCSVMQGYHYRGCKMPGYRDTVFYGDYCIDHIRGFRWNGRKPSQEKRMSKSRIYQVTSWGQDHQGELYLTTGGGEVFKLVPHVKQR